MSGAPKNSQDNNRRELRSRRRKGGNCQLALGLYTRILQVQHGARPRNILDTFPLPTKEGTQKENLKILSTVGSVGPSRAPRSRGGYDGAQKEDRKEMAIRGDKGGIVSGEKELKKRKLTKRTFKVDD